MNLAKIREATEKMEKMYEDKGFFLARITHRLVPTGEADNVPSSSTSKKTIKSA